MDSGGVDIDRFARDGFAAVSTLLDAETLGEIRGLYDQVLGREIDCGDDDRELGGLTRQVMNPRRHSKDVHDSAVYVAARAFASRLLGIDKAAFTFDMMIFKPPGHAAETPWHQDCSYMAQPVLRPGVPLPLATIQVWIALDDADEENGCMQFLPGVHRRAESLEHYVYSGDPADQGRLLALTDDALASLTTSVDDAVACPLPAGGATGHTEATPHFTGPNRSADRPRRAYILNFADPQRIGAFSQ